VDDSQHFLLEYFDPIHDSPSHIYHSALPLCPTSSWLHETYSAELSQEVKVVWGLPAEWGTCSHTVSFNPEPFCHACWKDIVAVGLRSGDISTLNSTTGVRTAVLSGHTDTVRSLTFTSDGALLVSGSDDKTIKLWDIQTGGIIKTFYGHTDWVFSVSISLDHTMIPSGALDKTIRLWNAQTGISSCIIDRHDVVESVSFSPTNHKIRMSGSRDYTIQQWDPNGHQIGPTYKGKYVAFSSDGTYFACVEKSAITIQNSSSGVVIAELITKPGSSDTLSGHCCFSPDNKFVGGIGWKKIYIWDITKSDPSPIRTLIGHAVSIASLTFSSSLISSSHDGSIKFWQISSLINPVATDLESPPLTPAPIVFVTLQVNDDVATTIDSAGGIKAWNILTGHCKASFYWEATLSMTPGDVQLVDSRLILVWYEWKQRYTEELARV